MPSVHSNILKKLISYTEPVIWRDVDAEYKNSPVGKCYVNYGLSQY